MAKKQSIEEVRAVVLAGTVTRIPEVCRKVREALGLTISEYAQMVGLNSRYLGDIERGTRDNPTVKILNKIVSPAGLTTGFIDIAEPPLKK